MPNHPEDIVTYETECRPIESLQVGDLVYTVDGFLPFKGFRYQEHGKTLLMLGEGDQEYYISFNHLDHPAVLVGWVSKEDGE